MIDNLSGRQLQAEAVIINDEEYLPAQESPPRVSEKPKRKKGTNKDSLKYNWKSIDEFQQGFPIEI